MHSGAILTVTAVLEEGFIQNKDSTVYLQLYPDEGDLLLKTFEEDFQISLPCRIAGVPVHPILSVLREIIPSLSKFLPRDAAVIESCGTDREAADGDSLTVPPTSQPPENQVPTLSQRKWRLA